MSEKNLKKWVKSSQDSPLVPLNEGEDTEATGRTYMLCVVSYPQSEFAIDWSRHGGTEKNLKKWVKSDVNFEHLKGAVR